MMLIPVCYDKGFSATVNGKKSDVYNIGDMFMGVPIEEGMNHIELRFIPRGLILGVLISILVLALLIFFEKKPVGHSALDKVSYIAFSEMWCIALVILYVIPIIAFIIHQIVKRLPMLH